jgi:hypothetical protein
MLQRRSEPRYMCADLVNIMIRLDDGSLAERIANLEEISSSGACIQLEVAMPVGTVIEVLCSTCSFRGKVGYCTFVELGYDIGIEFEKHNRWNRQRYEPKHLLPIPICKADVPEQLTQNRVRGAGASGAQIAAAALTAG